MQHIHPEGAQYALLKEKALCRILQGRFQHRDGELANGVCVAGEPVISHVRDPLSAVLNDFRERGQQHGDGERREPAGLIEPDRAVAAEMRYGCHPEIENGEPLNTLI